MSKLTNNRLARWILACLIIVTLVAVCVGVGILLFNGGLDRIEADASLYVRNAALVGYFTLCLISCGTCAVSILCAVEGD